MEKFILSFDQGTTSTRAILFDKKGQSRHIAQKEVECIFPKPGWVEQDPVSIWLSLIEVATEVCTKNGISLKQVDTIGITNQRETTVVWDKKTGKPVYNAIVWQSRQSQEICDALANKKDFIRNKTGLLINPYFSASKIRFILDNIPNGQKRAEKGELLFGTIDCWLIYNMTEGRNHVTDVTNASRTLLYNINTMDWDDEILKLFNIPRKMLPKVQASSSLFGYVSNYGREKISITGVAGDQQAALFGQNCFEKGDCKSTYGTGCFMLSNIGDKPIFSKNGLLTTIAWQIGDKVTYALEGSIYIGGSLVQWLRDGLEFFKNSADSEKMALDAKTNNGIYVVPAFVGLGTPYWDDKAKGAIFGLTRGSTKYQLIRASLEAIAYQCFDVIQVMKKEAKLNIKTLRVDGGATANKYLMQFQSDISNTIIKLPKCLETTALGAAYLAGLYTGYFKNIEEIQACHSYQTVYEPKMSKNETVKLYKGWKIAVTATRKFKLD